METIKAVRGLMGPGLRKLVIWAVLVLMVVSSLAVLPDDVEAQGPGRKDITLYIHNVTNGVSVGTLTTQRIMNTTVGSVLNTTQPNVNSVRDDWFLYPVLADDIAIAGNVSFHVWALRTIRTGDSAGAAISFTLYDVDRNGNDVATIASGSTSITMITDWKEYGIYTTGVASHTVPRGHSMRVYFDLSGTSSNYYQLAWGDGTKKTRLVIETDGWADINAARTLDWQRNPQTVFSQIEDNKTVIFHANVSDPYGSYDVKFVNATLVAPNGTRILDRAPMAKTAGYFNTLYGEWERSWNYTNYPTGQYNLTISIVSNSGWYYRYPSHPDDTTWGGHLETLTVYFWIGGMPHDVNITVLDDLDQPLEGAEVALDGITGITDASGNVVLRQANGTYTLKVYWQRVPVYSAPLVVNNDTTTTVRVAVYSPTIVCLDDVGDPVFDAVVFALHPNGDFLDRSWRTDAAGTVTWDTMAGGDYRISVLWMGVEVYNSTETIDGQGPFTITLMVYQLDISVVDSAGDGLELAQVVIVNTTNGLVADSKLTNFTGFAVSKVPIGSYDFRVYWRNELVFDDLVDHLVDDSGVLILQARIYAVDLLVVDASDIPLTNARVVVGFAVSGHVQDFGTTDDAGILGTRLPVGQYNFWVYWKDVLVNETRDFLYNGTGQHTIRASVFWVDLTVLDTLDVPVASALVTLRHADGLDFGTIITNSEGNVSYRLPHGIYTIVISWKETVVFDDWRDVQSDDPIVLNVAIYYLRLKVIDSRGAPIEAALVATLNLTSGSIVGSSVTDAAGEVTHRVPAGNYQVSVVWQESTVFTGMRQVADNELHTIVVAVYYVDIQVTDTMGNAVEGAIISFSNSSTGRSMGTRGTDADGNVSYRIPIGDYHMTVVWQEAVVYEADERVDGDRVLSVTATVYYAFITVEDTTHEPLAGAQVTITNPDTGRIMGSQPTDAEGGIDFRLPMGDYTITVVWQETEVYRALRTLDANDPIVLVANVYYAELHVVDSRDAALESALVTFTNTSSGRLMDEHTTGADGIVIFRLPRGTYTVVVIWQEAVVWQADRLLASNEPWDVRANVFYGQLRIRDSMDSPLEGALVSLTNASSGRPMGDRTTGSDGIVTYRIPMGVYTVHILWLDTVVFDDFVTVDSNAPHTLLVDVYYPTFVSVDSREVPLNGALVTVEMWSNGRIIGSQLTNSEGSITLRVPVGAYTVSVVWLDTLVHVDVYDVSSNEVFDIDAHVYYIGVTAADSKGLGLEFAQIAITNTTTLRTMGSQTANGDGSTEFRLPIGEYRVEAQWQHALVYDQVRTVTSDHTWSLEARVYYLTFHVTDGDGFDLPGAAVSLANETASTSLGPTNTDYDGMATFRLPVGDVAMVVVWRSVVVYTDDVVTVSEDGTVDIRAWVYYLTVRVVGSDGVKLKGVDMDLERDGGSIETAVTDKRGEVIFRLPKDTYYINMTYTTTYYLTPIDVKRSELLDLNASHTTVFKLGDDEYPIPFYKTNLFYVILLLVLLIIMLSLVMWRGRIAAKKAAEEAAWAKEPTKYEDGDLDDLLDDLSEKEEAPPAAILSSEPEEYSDEDLETVEDESDEHLGTVEEYTDEDLEKEETPDAEDEAEEEDEEREE